MLLLEVCLLMILVGCSAERIRNRAGDYLASGEYEKALDLIEKSEQSDPESAVLRAGSLQLRDQAVMQLLTRAGLERAAGRLDSAEKLLRRALPFDRSGDRVGAALAEVDAERRQRVALEKALELFDRDPSTALAIVQGALRENPSNRDLLSARQRLDAKLREGRLYGAATGLTESRPVTLDFRDVNLRLLLETITRNSGVNFVLDPDVGREIRVSIFMKSVRVEEAVEIIASTHGLAKKVLDERTILVYPNTPEKRREYQEQVVRIFHLSNSQAKDAAGFLRGMLKLREPYIDERTNFLALRETPENILLAERLLTLYDSAEPEVVLELEVIEVKATRLLNLGVKIPESITLTPLGPDGSTGSLTLGNIGSLGRSDVGLTLGSILLNLKREVGDYTTLATPKIRARSKEKAKILVGDKVPIVTTTTSTGGFVSDSVSYLDVGLKLEVQPTVYANNEVAMQVALEVSSVTREVQTAGGGLAYEISTRTAGTALRLRDGETQILAGLINREERSNASRIPGLGDLPIAGRLFSSQSDNNTRTELVLAITPRVVRNITVPDIGDSEIWIGTDSNTRLRTPVVPGQMTPPADAPGEPRLRNDLSEPLKVASSPSATTSESVAPHKQKETPDSTVALSWNGPRSAIVGESVALIVDADRTPQQDWSGTLSYDASKLELVNARELEALRSIGGRVNVTKEIVQGRGKAHINIYNVKSAQAQSQELTRLVSDADAGGRHLEIRFLARSAGKTAIEWVELGVSGSVDIQKPYAHSIEITP
ncbi:general secretion pathway protein GspD [Rubrivivax gelatinosus]|nr:general secretion pathway protein GspD [Rubrivivax gelatinosus]